MELLERGVGARAVDRGGAAVHQDGHPDRLGALLQRGAVTHRGVRMRGDAAVALLAHRDGKRDEFLGLGVERAFGRGAVMQRRKAFENLGNGAPELAHRPPQRFLDGEP